MRNYVCLHLLVLEAQILKSDLHLPDFELSQ